MPSIYQLKPRFQNLLRPCVEKLYRKGITANQVTLGAAGISLVVGAYLCFAPHTGLFLLIPFWMLLRMAFNAIDGMLAREYGQQSTLGAYLNELCDVVADTALFLPFAFVSGVSNVAVLGVIFMALLVEYAGVMGPLTGASRRYDGPMGKSDRAFCFGLMGLGVALQLSPLWINGVLIVMLCLLFYTLINRIKQGIQETKTAH